MLPNLPTVRTSDRHGNGRTNLFLICSGILISSADGDKCPAPVPEFRGPLNRSE